MYSESLAPHIGDQLRYTLATVMNPVGLLLKLVGNRAPVVDLLTPSSGSPVGIGAASSWLVVVGMALPSRIAGDAFNAVVDDCLLADNVTNAVYADAEPRSTSSLIMILISWTAGLLGAGCKATNNRTPSAIEANQNVKRMRRPARIQGIRTAFRGNLCGWGRGGSGISSKRGMGIDMGAAYCG
jgi:hypothetical protein